MTVMSPDGMRIPPAMPAAAYQTYSVHVPLRTHWRPATCAEVDCEAHQRGWATTVIPDSADEAAIKSSGRRWTPVERTPEGLHRYVFPAGQECFAAARHRVRLDRPEIYVRRDGDWRGNPLGTEPYVHTRADLWVEDFGERMQTIADAVERG